MALLKVANEGNIITQRLFQDLLSFLAQTYKQNDHILSHCSIVKLLLVLALAE